MFSGSVLCRVVVALSISAVKATTFYSDGYKLFVNNEKIIFSYDETHEGVILKGQYTFEDGEFVDCMLSSVDKKFNIYSNLMMRYYDANGSALVTTNDLHNNSAVFFSRMDANRNNSWLEYQGAQDFTPWRTTTHQLFFIMKQPYNTSIIPNFLQENILYQYTDMIKSASDELKLVCVTVYLYQDYKFRLTCQGVEIEHSKKWLRFYEHVYSFLDESLTTLNFTMNTPHVCIECHLQSDGHVKNSARIPHHLSPAQPTARSNPSAKENSIPATGSNGEWWMILAVIISLVVILNIASCVVISYRRRNKSVTAFIHELERMDKDTEGYLIPRNLAFTEQNNMEPRNPLGFENLPVQAGCKHLSLVGTARRISPEHLEVSTRTSDHGQRMGRGQTEPHVYDYPVVATSGRDIQHACTRRPENEYYSYADIYG